MLVNIKTSVVLVLFQWEDWLIVSSIEYQRKYQLLPASNHKCLWQHDALKSSNSHSKHAWWLIYRPQQKANLTATRQDDSGLEQRVPLPCNQRYIRLHTHKHGIIHQMFSQSSMQKNSAPPFCSHSFNREDRAMVSQKKGGGGGGWGSGLCRGGHVGVSQMWCQSGGVCACEGQTTWQKVTEKGSGEGSESLQQPGKWWKVSDLHLITLKR